MIKLVQTLGTTPGVPPTVYAMIPVPLMQHGAIGANQTVINSVYPALIPLISIQAGLKTVPISNYAASALDKTPPAHPPPPPTDPSPNPASFATRAP